jgi:hypothetical protein
MDERNLPTNPVRVTPTTVAYWIGADITRAELAATEAMARGDEDAALGMLARAGGLGDAYALITGACRGCGQHVGQPHNGAHCRSGGERVGSRGDVDPTYCADAAPARTGSFAELVEANRRAGEHTVWTPGGQA